MKSIFKENFSKNHFILFGINKISEREKGIYNSLIITNHQLEILEEYNKQKLVPFGEFLPMENFLKKFGLKKITEGHGSFLKGQKQNNLIIDKLNILNSSLHVMRDSVRKVCKINDTLYFDGNALPLEFRSTANAQSVVKGDSKVASIAAASIVAKVSRDFYMKSLNIRYPGYGWEKNVGYGVEHHKVGIYRLGINTEHRRSFKPIHNMLCL